MTGFGKSKNMKEERLKREVELYKDEVEQLESYLIFCIELFNKAGIELEGDGDTYPAPNLVNYIQGLIQYTTNLQESGGTSKVYMEGAKTAYKDCVDLLEDIADDTEKSFPGNEKIIKLATAYRKVGEAIQSKAASLKDFD